MIATEPIGWLNTALPMALLMLVALVLPRLLSGKSTRSQWAVSGAVAVTAVFLCLLGGGVFAVVYQVSGASATAAFAENILPTTLFFFGMSLKAVLFWGPVLILVWFGLAQGVERRRGEAIAKVGRA